MGRSADVRWRSVVRAELQSASSAVRAEAAYAAGELEAKDALRDVLHLLDDDVQSVRLAAIFALGRLGGREAREALEILSASDDEVEADAAEQALEEMSFYADPDSIPLFDESEEDDEWWERQDEE
jgi:HEAT repeat protein